MSVIRLGEQVLTGEPVQLTDDSRSRGMYVLGKTGTGKTTFLLNLILQDIAAGNGVCVLDPHGDLITDVLALLPPPRRAEVVLLDAAQWQYPFGLNLFDIADPTNPLLVDKTVSQMMQVFSRLWGDLFQQPLVADVLQNCCYLLVENPGYTLAEIPLLLVNDDFREQLLRNLTNQDARFFWEQQYAQLKPAAQLRDAESTLRRVRAFLAKQTVRTIVGQTHSTINFRACMDERKIVLIRLALGDLGEVPVTLLGTLLLSMLINAAYARLDVPFVERTPFYVYIDEYHRFATEDAAELLTGGRKFGIAMTVAHQTRDQFDPADPNRGATLNAGSLACFSLIGKDATELAGQFNVTPPPREATGRIARHAIDPQPVQQLLRKSHVDPDMPTFLRNLELRSLLSIAGTTKVLKSERHSLCYTSGQAAGHGIELINDYLVRVMREEVEQGAPAEAELILRIFLTLRGFIEIYTEGWYKEYGSPYSSGGGIYFQPEAMPKHHEQALTTFLHWLIPAYWETPEVINHLEEAHAWCSRGYSAWYVTHVFDRPTAGDDPSQKASSDGLDTTLRFLGILADNDTSWQARSYTEQRAFAYPAAQAILAAVAAKKTDLPIEQLYPLLDAFYTWKAAWWLKNMLRWVTNLIALAATLYCAPTLVETSQYEPLYDQQRSYADMRNEVANELANLPPLQAKVKLPSGEYQIAVSRPATGTMSWRGPTMPTSYTRPQQAVVAEIRQRQAGKGAILAPLPHENDLPATTTPDDEDDWDYLRESKRGKA